MQVTKWLIWSISLLFILGCGEEMAKPTLSGKWARGGTKVDVTSMADTGFEKTALEYAKLNGILYQQGEWADFTDRAFGKTYYVQCTSGSDSTGDGSVDYPFKTIKHAVDLIEDGGYGKIILAEAGDYDIDDDIDLINKNVWIVTLINSTNAVLNFISYTDSGTENNLYRFNLYRNSNLILEAQSIKVDAPHNAGIDWNADTTCVAVYDGLSNVSISAYSTISFSATVATGTDLPSLVMSLKSVYDLVAGIPCLTINTNGGIDTNDKGYVLNANGNVAIVNNVTGGIDNSQYFWKYYNTYLYVTGKPFDGSDSTFAFGYEGWDSGTYQVLEKTIDVGNSVQDFFDVAYGSSVFTATGSGALNYIITVIGSHIPNPIKFKHEISSTATTTYGIVMPIRGDSNIIRNF